MNINQICIIDDDRWLIDLLSDYARQMDISTYGSISWTTLDKDQLKKSQLIILDLSLPEFDGLDIIEFLENEDLSVPILLCSGHDENVVETAADLLKAHGLNYAGKLLKPFTFKQFKNQLVGISLLPMFKASKPSVVSQPLTTNISKDCLIEAIKENRFKLLYQPQICNFTGSLYGVESLARLMTAENTVIMPDIFIPLLEKYALMEKFTLKMIELGLTQLEKINLPKRIKVGFNISASSIHGTFITDLTELCNQFKIVNQDIVLELTETAILQITTDSKKLLTKLRLQGFNLSLDDFGTGYSTIQEIDNLPFNQIKIDKIFTQSIESKNSSKAIVAATIELANKLNCVVVAEGVEVETQADMLTLLNCPVSQGYFYSFPLSIEELKKLLIKHKANSLSVVTGQDQTLRYNKTNIERVLI
jgi:EAL domain-containing protein (putative c-di-GMP-specific phosphodiesterase class I)